MIHLCDYAQIVSPSDLGLDYYISVPPVHKAGASTLGARADAEEEKEGEE